jgi:hypothetical protein
MCFINLGSSQALFLYISDFSKYGVRGKRNRVDKSQMLPRIEGSMSSVCVFSI